MSKVSLNKNNLIIYQTKNGGIELRKDLENKTLWLTQIQVAELFDVQKAAISKHVKNIFQSKELETSTVSVLETVQKEGYRNVVRKVEHYNLDLVISIGYRVNSLKATQFRRWATEILRDHITKGFTVNKNLIAKNYDAFMFAVNEVKNLLPADRFTDTKNVLDLVSLFANTWISLDAYDKGEFKKNKINKKKVKLTAKDLSSALEILKTDLVEKGTATALFAVDRHKDSLEGIVGNVMQSIGGKYVYESVEEKAVHLLYFIIKNHPFTDGNKRSGAFAFVWFLEKNKILDIGRISPEALTSLTLLVAESDPADKERIIKLLLMMVSKR